MLKGEKQVVFNSIKETDEMVTSAEVSDGSNPGISPRKSWLTPKFAGTTQGRAVRVEAASKSKRG
jgi:hypothetical protein